MATTKKMRLIKGKHVKLVDGERIPCKKGDIVELTPNQVKAFGDKFEDADLAAKKLAALQAADADADKAAAEKAAAEKAAAEKAAAEKAKTSGGAK